MLPGLFRMILFFSKGFTGDLSSEVAAEVGVMGRRFFGLIDQMFVAVSFSSVLISDYSGSAFVWTRLARRREREAGLGEERETGSGEGRSSAGGAGRRRTGGFTWPSSESKQSCGTGEDSDLMMGGGRRLWGSVGSDTAEA